MAPIRSRCRMKVSLFDHCPFTACGSPTSGLVEKRSTASKPIGNGMHRPFHNSSPCASAGSLKWRATPVTPRLFGDNVNFLPEMRAAIGGLNPRLGQDLALAPTSALEKKLPQLGHVAWVYLKVAPTVSIPAGICRPRDVSDAEWFKKLSPSERQRVRARGL